MKKTAFIIYVLFTLFPKTIFANEIAWNDINKKVIDLYKEGNNSEAIELAKNTLTEANKINVDNLPVEGITLLANLGQIYKKINQLSEAENTFKAALEQLSKSDPLDPAYAHLHSATHKALGEILILGAKYKEAEAAMSNALQIMENYSETNEIKISNLQNSLSAICKKNKKYETALNLLTKALEIRKKHFGNDHIKTGEIYHNIADLYMAQQKFDDAEKYYLLSLSVFEKNQSGAEVVYPIDTLAFIYKNKGKYIEAESFYRRSLTIKEKFTGKNTIDYASTCNYLAMVYIAEGKDEAETLLLMARSIYEKLLQPGDPRIADILFNLAEFYKKKGEEKKAKKYRDEAEQIYAAL